MKRYEVQTDTICDGWVNTWQSLEGGQSEPETFESFAEAEAALDEFLAEIEEEIALGQRQPDEGYSREEFRIIQIETAEGA